MVSADQLSAFRNCVDDILASLGKFLADLTDAPSREVGDAQASMDSQLQHFFKIYYGLRKRHDDASLSAAILALTKSGKSTLLNAIMGRECLPMNNVPETARLCKIEHCEDVEPRMIERGEEYRGDVEIRRRLQEINSEVRAREYLPQDDQMLHIFTPVAFFNGQDSSGTKFFLLDTPGPNEAGEEGLRYQVERLLDGVDAVIYLLDYTKLKTAEEAAIFTRLKQINPLLVRRLSQRLFFVVNKADQLHESEGLDEQDTKEYVAQLVTQQLAFEGFHLTPDQVILLSARNALSARLVLTGQPPSERFYRQAFGARWQKRLPSLTPADVEGAAEELLDESGIRDLEERVLGFLYSHSATLKVLAVVDDVARLLQEVWNVTESCRAALAKTVAELQSQTEDMRAQLQETLKDFENTMHHAETLQSGVTDEIRQHLDNLRTKLFNYIMQTLEPEIQGAAAPVAGRPQSGRWKSIRDKFLGLFGAGRSASRSKDELASLLIELHEDLLTQINNEVSEFWHVLEGCTSMRHMQLISSINQQLKHLSGRVEHIVSEALDVELEAVQISLSMPSAEQFHSDLQELITRGIAEKTERHIRVGQRKYEERVMRFRQGLCRLGTYWESVPRTRTVVETYNVTVFQVQPSEILNHFIHMVDSAVDNTGAVLHAYVRQFMNDQVDQAREKITAYADRYMKAMSSALNSSSAGEAARKEALAQVAARLSHVEELRGAVSELQGKVESVVPQHDYEEVDFELYEMLMEQQREQERKEVEAAQPAVEAALAALATGPSTSTAEPSPSTAPGASLYETLLQEAGIVTVPSAAGKPTAEQTPEQSPAQGLIPTQAVEETEQPVVTEPEMVTEDTQGVRAESGSAEGVIPSQIDEEPEQVVTAQGAGVNEGATSVQEDAVLLGSDQAVSSADSAVSVEAPVADVAVTEVKGDEAITKDEQVVEDSGDAAVSPAESAESAASERELVFDDANSVVVVPTEEDAGDSAVSEQSVEKSAQEEGADAADVAIAASEDVQEEAGEQLVEDAVKLASDAQEKEDDTLLFVDTAEEPEEEDAGRAGDVVPQGGVSLSQDSSGMESAREVSPSDVATLGSDFNSVASVTSEEGLLEGDVPTLGADGEVVADSDKEGILAEQVSPPTSPAPFRPVVEVAADYTNITPSSPLAPAPPSTIPPAHPPLSPSVTNPQATLPAINTSTPTIPPAVQHTASPPAPLPVVDASKVAGEREADGYRISSEDPEYAEVQREDVPFDYQREMFALMSTSQVSAPAAPGSPTSDDGWEVVEDA